MARVLVVEDDIQLRDAIREGLAYFGHEVQVAATASQAICSLEQLPFDLVLSDIMLAPDGDGYAVLERARQLQPPLPVVLITGAEDPSRSVRALQDGAMDCLSKPVSLQQLRQAVEQAIRRGLRAS